MVAVDVKLTVMLVVWVVDPVDDWLVDGLVVGDVIWHPAKAPSLE